MEKFRNFKNYNLYYCAQIIYYSQICISLSFYPNHRYFKFYSGADKYLNKPTGHRIYFWICPIIIIFRWEHTIIIILYIIPPRDDDRCGPWFHARMAFLEMKVYPVTNKKIVVPFPLSGHKMQVKILFSLAPFLSQCSKSPIKELACGLLWHNGGKWWKVSRYMVETIIDANKIVKTFIVERKIGFCNVTWRITDLQK